MMRLVAFFVLVAVAVAQEEDGSYDASKYENPYAYNEQSAAPQYQPQQYQPEAAPQYQPQAAPQYQPQQYQPQAAPQYRPQVPQYQPQAPQYQPQAAPQYQPQAAPQYQPQQYQPQAAPQYQPQQYQPQAAPQYRPQVPQYQPQAPQYQPQYARAGAAPASTVNGLPQTSTNYKTEESQRFEDVDGQGNVRGQYSYVDPNGKTITVKYTAGKDGFKVEGDHLPRPPVAGAAPAAPAPAAYQQPQYQPAAYQQPQYQQPAAPAYQPRYQPAPAAGPAGPALFQPARPARPQGPLSAADQYLAAPLQQHQHRFAAAPNQAY
ncbi:DNA-directed RNA polymerase II subunit RPB1-like [Frankliniella occidentalis]|uniref:DNA-directed RNA polymerase II subunit RPB1-like n=1 Tax=Frankliniella occidentalis TaxID=133901 RepID=A0A6J1T589_FRAOC|nr:DNA-directed RNA polymerase II subunit RPB1-like [Frankliniella occidentalis]